MLIGWLVLVVTCITEIYMSVALATLNTNWEGG